MKTFIIYLSIALALSSSCKKKSDSASSTVSSPPATGVVYRGVVRDNVCCQIVVQTLGPGYFGLASWVDSGRVSYPVYTHVFKVANPCEFGNHPEGDTISFKITQLQAQNCVCCLAYIKTPDLAYAIEVIN